MEHVCHSEYLRIRCSCGTPATDNTNPKRLTHAGPSHHAVLEVPQPGKDAIAAQQPTPIPTHVQPQLPQATLAASPSQKAPQSASPDCLLPTGAIDTSALMQRHSLFNPLSLAPDGSVWHPHHTDPNAITVVILDAYPQVRYMPGTLGPRPPASPPPPQGWTPSQGESALTVIAATSGAQTFRNQEPPSTSSLSHAPVARGGDVSSLPVLSELTWPVQEVAQLRGSLPLSTFICVWHPGASTQPRQREQAMRVSGVHTFLSYGAVCCFLVLGGKIIICTVVLQSHCITLPADWCSYEPGMLHLHDPVCSSPCSSRSNACLLQPHHTSELAPTLWWFIPACCPPPPSLPHRPVPAWCPASRHICIRPWSASQHHAWRM